MLYLRICIKVGEVWNWVTKPAAQPDSPLAISPFSS